jgi:hypothetical protein
LVLVCPYILAYCITTFTYARIIVVVLRAKALRTTFARSIVLCTLSLLVVTTLLALTCSC